MLLPICQMFQLFLLMFNLEYRKSSKKSGAVVNSGEMERFVKRNLSVHTKGLLRKKITIHTMLSWTRETIRKPMIMTKSKQV